MSFAIDLGEYGPDLKKQYESVISSDPETTWTVFGYDGSGNALKPSESGSGELDDFVEAFDDAQIQYGLVRVEFNGVNKIVLVGHVGENVSGRKRLVFNSHMTAVAREFAGHHIQITAFSSDELTPRIIMDRVNAAAGSKYVGSTQKAPSTKPRYVKADDGADEDDWGEVAPVKERELTHGSASGYKSSARDELQSFRKHGSASAKKPVQPLTVADDEDEEARSDEADSPAGISGLNSGTSYKPVGKIDLKAIREEAKHSKFADARIEKIEPSYKPVGKVDLKAIREQARKEKQLKAERESLKPAASRDDEVPKKAPAPVRHDSDDEEDTKPVTKKEFANNATESHYSAPDHRAEYGAKSTQSKGKPLSRSGGDDDDEPRFSSLSERMKAFQENLSGAKPKFDVKSTPKSTPSRPVSAARSSPAPHKPSSERAPDFEDQEEEAPLSVAAQLAKSRLSGNAESIASNDDVKSARQASYGVKNDEKKQAKERPEDGESQAAVSTFAARFARKSEEPEKANVAEKKKEEEDTPPAPARRVPQPAAAEPPVAPLPPRRAPEPEPEPVQEEEMEVGLVAIVIQEYTKDDDDEITLMLEETITDIQKVDENWWIGKNSSGDVGLFPADYVKVNGENKGSRNGKAAAASVGDDEEEEKIAIALYSHEPNEEDEDELAFAENEKLVILDFTSDDWWTGRNTKGEVGLFPANYAKLQ